MTFSRNRLATLALATTIVGVSAQANAASILFPDLTLVAGTNGTAFPTTATSALGTLSRSATLNFTLTTSGATYVSDLRVAIQDPGGTTATAALPGAQDGPGTYSGAVTFASLAPTSGTYKIFFTNTFGTSYDVTLSGISLGVTPVPEPTTMAALALGGLVALRRRKRA